MSYNKDLGVYKGYIYKIYNDVNNKIYIGQTITSIKDRWHGHMSAVLNEKRHKSVLYQAMRKYGRDKFHIQEIDKIVKQSQEELIDALNELEEIRIVEYHSLVSDNGYNLERGGKNKKVRGRVVHKYDINLNYIETYESCCEAGRQNGIDSCTVYGCCKHYYYTAGGYVWSFDGETPVKPDYSKRESKKKSTKKEYVSKALPVNVKRKRRLERLGFVERRIYVYNSFGEVVVVYEDAVDAIDNIPIKAQELRKNLNGENLCYGKTVIRYENEGFDKYPKSSKLQAISVYDICGNFIDRFETIIDAEKFVGCLSGEVLKTIKRGGSCKNYLFSFYGYPLVRKVLKRTKEINMLDKHYNVIRTFDSIAEINKFFNISDVHHVILDAIKNKTQYRGYFWNYRNEFAVNG